MLFEEFDFPVETIPTMSDVEIDEAIDRAWGFLASNLCGDFGSENWDRFNAWYAGLQAEQQRRAGNQAPV